MGLIRAALGHLTATLKRIHLTDSLRPIMVRTGDRLWTFPLVFLSARRDASPYRSGHAKVGRILWMSRDYGPIMVRTGDRLSRGVAELRPPSRKSARADPNVRLQELNVCGHHPKRRPAAHSKGACHVHLDCPHVFGGSAGRLALPIRSREGRANPPDEPQGIGIDAYTSN